MRPALTVLAGSVLFLAALLGLLNDLPDFFERTLPWLAERVRVGPLLPTTFQLVAAAGGAVAAGVTTLATYRMHRETRRHAEASPYRNLVLADDGMLTLSPRMLDHGFAGVGRDYVRCLCGWKGSKRQFEKHVARGNAS